jgi:spore maturation protein CgeB
MHQSLSILYLGPLNGTCLDRANALRRLGHQVQHIDLRTLLPKTAWIDRIIWRMGSEWLNFLLIPNLIQQLDKLKFDLCYVDGGELVTPKAISILRQHASQVINYNIDDPIGPRDGERFSAYRKSLPFYDLIVVVREDNVDPAYALGAKKVLRVYRSADEVSHAPRLLTKEDHQKWDSDVLFLGTWFPERGPFLLDLIRSGVSLTIRGSNWHKAAEWPQLKKYYKGGAIAGDDYAKAIQCAKVNLGLLSKDNRDLHTTRSLEIPALGGLLCAERTSEHSEMYLEGTEALFWSGVEDCAKVCSFILSHEDKRQEIAMAGHERVKRNQHFNEMVLKEILSHV